MVHKKKKKIQLEKYIKFSNKEADNLSLKAEETRNFNLIIKCNSRRKGQNTRKWRLNSLKQKLLKKREY